MTERMPIQPKMCATCPFKEGSPHANLRDDLAESALRDASRICHSTGTNALYKTNAPEKICRGSRDLQIQVFYRMGFLSEPTDAAWEAKCSEMGIKPDTHKGR